MIRSESRSASSASGRIKPWVSETSGARLVRGADRQVVKQLTDHHVSDPHAEQAAAKGLTLIDAEVSGGERGAIAKSLCYMVGGDKAAFEKCRPIFATSGVNIFHLGDLGSGAITKLAHNLIVYVNVLAASEGMRLAEKAGVDLKSMEQVVHAGAAQSRVADHWSQQSNLKDTYTR